MRPFFVESALKAFSTTTGRPLTKLVELVGKTAVTVTAALHDDEGLEGISALPGASRYLVQLVTRTALPAPFEAAYVHDEQSYRGRGANDHSISGLDLVAFTRSPLLPAWVGTRAFVSVVQAGEFSDQARLEYFRTDCLDEGHSIVAPSVRVDALLANGRDWEPIGLPDGRVLVLAGDAALKPPPSGDNAAVPWTVVATPSGEVTQPGALWRPGSWAIVTSPDDLLAKAKPDPCADVNWTHG